MNCQSFIKLLVITAVIASCSCDEYDDNIVFTVQTPNLAKFRWNFGTNITSQGCDVNGKFAFISHGWLSSTESWISTLVQKFRTYRGGCIITMNWGKYSDIISYDKIINIHFKNVSNALSRRLIQLESEGVSGDNIFMYGHSLGARLSIDAAITFGPGKVFQIDACDSAKPDFATYDTQVDSRSAAKNVQCIHTSSTLGTNVYQCDQNWLMGYCGIFQPAAKPLSWFLCFTGLCSNADYQLSHTLCNNFYISAFENDFVANNFYGCSKTRSGNSLPYRFKMGYMETRRSKAIQGSMAAPTTFSSPYNFISNVVY